jgi:hypothetical protein
VLSAAGAVTPLRSSAIAVFNETTIMAKDSEIREWRAHHGVSCIGNTFRLRVPGQLLKQIEKPVVTVFGSWPGAAPKKIEAEIISRWNRLRPLHSA